MRPSTKSLFAAAALLLGMSVQAQAQTVRLTAILSGGSEAPAQVLTGATGTGEVLVNMATQDVTYTIRIFNIPSGTTAGHFHVGSAGTAGPVVVDLAPPPQISNDFVLTGTATAASLRPNQERGIRDWTDFIQSLVGGQMYLNIHTNVNPGGEIRGQLTVVP
jgi:hypothetical protein